jgi:2-polyprenyl-6-methoxyphenol hydroxylase-like FAD-dependent oxidoreductase
MRVIVVGSGYAGTIAANRLAKKCRDAEIVKASSARACTNQRASQLPRKRRWRLLLSTGSGSARRSCFRPATGISTFTVRALLRAERATQRVPSPSPVLPR